MVRFSRREFIEQSLFAAAVAGVGPLPQEGGPKAPPSGRVRVAVIGVKGQGMVHVNKLLAMADVELAAICDPDEGVAGSAAAAVEKKSGRKPAIFADLRKLLEDKTLDAVTIATPNHWHVLASMWAVQAGKDVYVEKPLSHNLWEGRQLVAAARKYGRMVQMGNYTRSLQHYHDVTAFLGAKKLGRVKLVRGICYIKRGSIGKHPDGPPPPGVDYNLWLGPAPERPFNKNRFHYNWHWNWDFGGGEIANNGIYQLDIARWGLGKTGHPERVVSLGARLGYEDDAQTPNLQISVLDYGDVSIVHEVRGLPTEKYPPDVSVGNVFVCEEGSVVASINGSAAFSPKGELLQRFAGAGDHWRNFIDAVKSRKRESLNSEVLEGHLSTSLCHLANISYRLGALEPADKAKVFAGSEAGQEAWTRMAAHLKENGVDLAASKLRLGRELRFDGAAEKFVDAKDADALLRREYRAPFVVPEIV